MTFDEAVERRARAICETPEEDAVTIVNYDELPDRWKEFYRRQARTTFTDDDEAGYVLVPKEATGAMLAAARTENTTICEDEINAAIAEGAVKEE